MIPEAVNYEPQHRKIIMNSSLKKVREVNKKKIKRSQIEMTILNCLIRFI